MKKLSLLLSAPIISLPLVAISCSKNYDDIKLNNTFAFDIKDYEQIGKIFDSSFETEIIKDLETRETEKIITTLWERFAGVDATITRVFDGDTVEVSVVNNLTEKTSFAKGELVKIRIPLIDTLEQNTEGVTEREKKLSNLDSKFVETILRPGTKVRLLSDNWTNGSYNRKVAYLFFGENYHKNFSIEMLSNGWTLPRISQTDFKTFKIDYNNVEKTTVLSYLLPYVARAFNDGYMNKKGFYVEEGVNITLSGTPTNIKFKLPMDLSKEYIAHGSTLMSDAYQFLHPHNIDKKNRAKFVNPENNIFEFLITQKK